MHRSHGRKAWRMALKGDARDGHDFVEAAFAAGAVAALVSRAVEGVSGPQLLVAHTQRGLEDLARASRAPRDAAWIADGLVSDHWAAVSPVTGRLDAFLWMYPQESISYTDQPNGDAAGSAPIRLPPAPVAARVVQDSKRPMQKTATSVVFPLVTSPDDPGPMDASGDDEASQTGKPAKPVHLFGG